MAGFERNYQLNMDAPTALRRLCIKAVILLHPTPTPSAG